MNVIVTVSRGKERTYMKTFTIDEQNNITAFGTEEEAAATTTTPFDSFASQQELAALATQWPAERLVALWNSLPGMKPVKSFKTAKVAAGHIWERIQSLGETPKPKAERKAKGGACQGQGNQEDHHRKECAQGQKGGQGRGKRWAPRGQQDGPGGRQLGS